MSSYRPPLSTLLLLASKLTLKQVGPAVPDEGKREAGYATERTYSNPTNAAIVTYKVTVTRHKDQRMALSSAERKRASRARKAELARQAGDPTDLIAKSKFNQFLSLEEWNEVATYLEWAGIDAKGIPEFETDDDPGFRPEYDVGMQNRGSIGRAERMVSCLLDAAGELASLINRYKREEIDREIADLEARDLGDPLVRRQTLGEIVRLTKLREQLEKNHRHSLPQWRVTAL